MWATVLTYPVESLCNWLLIEIGGTVQSDGVEVDPVEMAFAGAQLIGGAADAATAFASHYRRLSDAAAGLFTSSSAALSGKIDSWQQVTSALSSRVNEHGTHLSTSASVYQETDATTSTMLYRLTESDSANPRLDI